MKLISNTTIYNFFKPPIETSGINTDNVMQTDWEEMPSAFGREAFDYFIGGKMMHARKPKKQNDIIYNNFPFPDAPGTAEVQAVESAAQRLLEVRAGLLATGKTLADLYDPNKMPAELLALHKELDAAVDACYGVRKGFESEAKRVGWLFGRWGEVVKK